MGDWVSQKLASWATNLQAEKLPEEVLCKAEDCIIDAIACAIPGSLTQGAQRVHSVASTTYGKGDACLWFSEECLHPTGAAFANAASASMLDIDDGHRRALGHPGAAIVPAVLASSTAETRGIDVLANVVACYEVSIRAGMSENRKAYHSGNWSGFGAAVAVARASQMSSDQLMHALAITAYHGPRVADLTLSQDMGANVKESIPWSVVTGMMAANLAQQGFSGCRDVLNIEERYTPAIAIEGLDQGYFPTDVAGTRVSHAILRTYFKRYACCRWIHSAVEGLLTIMRNQKPGIEEIDEIRVETFLQSANLNNLVDPATLESAQYSVPYCMAVAAVEGEDALAPLTAESLHRFEVIQMANKIKVEWDEKLDALFPHKNPSRVVVKTKDSFFEESVSVPWGEPERSPSRSELHDKFRKLANGRIKDRQATDILAAIEGLRDGKVESLLGVLKSPATG